MKKVKEAMKEKGSSEDQIKEFETAAQGYAKKIVANFKDYDFLIGESMDPDGMYDERTKAYLVAFQRLISTI